MRRICVKRPSLKQENVLVTICPDDKDHYRFGFNGQEKVNEWSGIGNHNTAEFWEYDTRTGRRLNLDPIDQINISNYAAFANSPIFFVDPHGDKVYYTFLSKTAEADRNLLQQKINAGFGGFATATIDQASGRLVIQLQNDKDITKANDEVQAFYGVMQGAVGSNTDIKMNVVNLDEDVSVGSYENGTIDIGDMDAIDNMVNETELPNAATSQSKLAHETAEQQYKQENGYTGMEGFEGKKGAHEDKGLVAEDKVNGKDIKRKNDGTDPRNGATTQQYKVKGKNVTLIIKEKPRTSTPPKTTVTQKSDKK